MTATTIPTVSNNNLSIHNGQVTTTSLDVARIFGKQHKNILRDIDNLAADVPPEFYRLNFEQTVKNRPSPLVSGATIEDRVVLMTRDGFTLLAMGFTGKKAMQFKIAYIEAFNRMEAELAQRQSPSPLPLHLKRFLTTADEEGRLTMREINPEAHIVTMQDLPRRLVSPDTVIKQGEGAGDDKDLLMQIAAAASLRASMGARNAQLTMYGEVRPGIKKTE